MYEMTNAACKKCRIPFNCCSPEYCEIADEYSQKQGISLQRTDHPVLPFMGPDGCIVPPDLRPICTVHVCNIDPDREARYFELREELSEDIRL